MGNIVHNISKGRFVEFAERVNANDPANSVFVIAALASSGIEADSVLVDKATLAAVVSGSTDEATNTGYARKVIDNTGGIVVTYDNTNDWVTVDVPDQTWTGVAAGSNWAALVFGYDSDSTAGTDTGIVPMTKHDFPITPDGSDVTVQIATFAKAS